MFPASVDDYLPERHLARFVVEVVEQLDLDPFIKSYSGRGSKAWHPSLMLSLLFYGYATGVFSSRKLEKATHDSIAFRYICAMNIRIMTVLMLSGSGFVRKSVTCLPRF